MSGRGPPALPALQSAAEPRTPRRFWRFRSTRTESCTRWARHAGREDLQPGRRSVRFRTPHERRAASPRCSFRSSLLVVVGAYETHAMPPKVEGVQHEHARGHRESGGHHRRVFLTAEARRRPSCACRLRPRALAAQREMATAPNERGVVATTADETGEKAFNGASAAPASLGRRASAARPGRQRAARGCWRQERGAGARGKPRTPLLDGDAPKAKSCWL